MPPGWCLCRMRLVALGAGRRSLAASNDFATFRSGILFSWSDLLKKCGWEEKEWGAGGDRRGCWREQWRKILFLKCEAKHPHCPTRTFFLPRRKMIFSGQLYSGVIVQSSANGLCQAVVTLQSYWQERWQVGEDYKGTLRDIF